MPTPLEILLDPISLCLLGLYAALMLWEAVFPARKLPNIPYWHVKGIISFFIFFYLSSYLPLWYSQWLPSRPLINLTHLNVIGASILGVLLYEFGMYVWHRGMHTSNILWRTFHQLHHSAERLDTYGAFYFSPLDMIGFTVLGTICFSFIMGLPAQAVTVFLLASNFLSIFQHANIKTPVWLGYIIQRPESHAVHHGKGVHAYNYSDLPVFDILFGTFRNPSGFIAETGFYTGASSKIKDMLSFKDVSKILVIVLMFTSTAFSQDLSEKSIGVSTGVTLTYVESGEHGNTPIILLHGYTDSWHSFETVIPKFSADYHVMAPTHRGHGNSSKPSDGYEMKNFADDVAAFMEEKKLEKCIIVGHSLGGLIAQQLAMRYPQRVRAIVLVATDASFADNPGVPEFLDEVNKLNDPISYDFASAFQYSTIYKPIDSLQVNVFINESLKVPAEIWKNIGRGIMKTDFSSDLHKILAPTLILWGNRDLFCPWNAQENFSAAIPNATLKVYEDIGHAVHWENGDQFVKDIELFISQQK